MVDRMPASGNASKEEEKKRAVGVLNHIGGKRKGNENAMQSVICLFTLLVRGGGEG